MKNLILATASVLALGIAGSGIGNAADTYDSSTSAPGVGSSIASLPPADQPRAASHNSIPYAGQHPLTPSPAYVGPAPGAGTGPVPPRFDKSADWDANASLHPYSSVLGPKPN